MPTDYEPKTITTASDPAWSAWFSFQYDLREDVTALIQERTKGRSDAFKTAIYSALIETLAENMRLFITLPDPRLIDGSRAHSEHLGDGMDHRYCDACRSEQFDGGGDAL